MRLFFALWPPPAAARALARWAKEVQRQTGGRVIDEAKIHLTLAFLGDAEPALAIAAGRRVKARAHGLPMEQARYWRANDVVWAGPRDLPASLKALHADLSTELRREHFVLEERPFAAHVTLIRKARAPKALPPLPPVDWPVNEFALVGSSLSPKGPAYESLERFSLG
jgi:RNA 2',3'-cyclic 3'-phosphodiesterase